MRQVVAKVTKNRQILLELQRPEARNILGSWIIWLSCPEIAQEAKPGQFVMVRCGGECLLPRPFSIHQVNDDGDIALFFAVWEDGRGTSWLSQRHVGDTVELFGPLGNGYSINPTSKNLLMVAGGIGIAPLRFLADEALKQGKEVNLLVGAQTSSQLYPESLLPSGIGLAKTTEDGSAGERGMITDSFRGFVSFTVAEQIFACGPLPMYKTMSQIPELNNKPVQVSLEVRMGCGRGVCYGCTLKTKQGLKLVCQDGPVFDLDDILWDELNFF